MLHKRKCSDMGELTEALDNMWPRTEPRRKRQRLSLYFPLRPRLQGLTEGECLITASEGWLAAKLDASKRRRACLEIWLRQFAWGDKFVYVMWGMCSNARRQRDLRARPDSSQRSR